MVPKVWVGGGGGRGHRVTIPKQSTTSSMKYGSALSARYTVTNKAIWCFVCVFVCVWGGHCQRGSCHEKFGNHWSTRLEDLYIKMGVLRQIETVMTVVTSRGRTHNLNTTRPQAGAHSSAFKMLTFKSSIQQNCLTSSTTRLYTSCKLARGLKRDVRETIQGMLTHRGR